MFAFDDIIDHIFCGDVLKCFQAMPDNFVHLIITSPPYNIGISYENHDDNMPHCDYLNWLGKAWKECERVLVKGGRLCINIGENKRMGNEMPAFAAFISQCARELKMLYRGTIIWNKNSANKFTAWGSWNSPSNPHIVPIHEYVIVFSKGDYKLNGKASDVTLDQEGKTFAECAKSIWNIGTESKKRISHPAPFPVSLPKKLINFYTFKGQIVLDPFGGSGTTAIAAIESDRHFVMFDNSKTYCEIALERLRETNPNKKISLTIIE